MRSGGLVLPLAFMLALAGSAGAAPTPRERTDAAILSNKARAAAKEKRHDEAAELLRQADQLDPTPQRKLDLAKSLAELGKLVEASGVLNSVVNDTTLKSKWHQESAKKQLSAIEPRIPWLSVHVVGPTTGIHAEIDGKEVQPDTESPVDPGPHSVGAEAEGYASGDRQVTLKEGEHKEIRILLEPVAKEGPKPEPTSSGGTKVPGIIAFSVGAVGIGVGAVFGILAFDETAKVRAVCDGNKCPARPEVVTGRNAALANGNVSTVGFVIGGVAVAAGVVLLLTVGSSSEKPAEQKKDAITLVPYIGASEGAGEAGLVGRF